jgi:hypothetical protein
VPVQSRDKNSQDERWNASAARGLVLEIDRHSR